MSLTASRTIDFKAVSVDWSLKVKLRPAAGDEPARVLDILMLWCVTPKAEAVAQAAIGVDTWRLLEAMKPFLASDDQAAAFETASRSFGVLEKFAAAEVLARMAETLRQLVKGRV